jgi:hypothetical protein
MQVLPGRAGARFRARDRTSGTRVRNRDRKETHRPRLRSSSSGSASRALRSTKQRVQTRPRKARHVEDRPDRDSGPRAAARFRDQAITRVEKYRQLRSAACLSEKRELRIAVCATPSICSSARAENCAANSRPASTRLPASRRPLLKAASCRPSSRSRWHWSSRSAGGCRHARRRRNRRCRTPSTRSPASR